MFHILTCNNDIYWNIKIKTAYVLTLYKFINLEDVMRQLKYRDANIEFSKCLMILQYNQKNA